MEHWLEANAADSPGLWLQIAKKGAPAPSVTYAEALDVALCFGWIDGQKRGLDETYWLQRFTPRRPRSHWSRINREKADAAARRQDALRPAGVAEVDAREGRRPLGGRLRRPADRRSPPTSSASSTPTRPRAFFADLDRANRYAILYRVDEAKRPETRARRIAQFVAMLARGEKIHA